MHLVPLERFFFMSLCSQCHSGEEQSDDKQPLGAAKAQNKNEWQSLKKMVCHGISLGGNLTIPPFFLFFFFYQLTFYRGANLERPCCDLLPACSKYQVALLSPLNLVRL